MKEYAQEKGVSISKYVKDKVFPQKDSFENIWLEFIQKLELFPANVEFNVSNIIGHNRWQTLDKSSKLSIARLFSKKITSNEYTNIEYLGRSGSNVSIYKKIL